MPPAEHRGVLAPPGPPGFDEQAAEIPDHLLRSPVWTDEAVAASGIPVVDVPFVTVGGGMGSFVMVDVLRIAGVRPEQVKVLTNLRHPWENYAYLTGVSQLPPNYRIRSDASSMPDNLWGFPSYAARRAFRSRSVTGFLAPLWNVLTENLLTDYWTPLAGEVFEGMRREADRIGYWDSVAHGQARMVRRRAAGGYFTVFTTQGARRQRVIYRSAHVQLAVGYPSIRFLPDMQEFRARHGNAQRFVNAYEPHEHVYEDLKSRPGTVVVRGGGIAASAIIHRLLNDREQHGAQTRIVHLLRNYVSGPHGPSRFMRRRGGKGWAHQGFNWPKASWGGQLKMRLERAGDDERRELWKVMKGSTTPYRKGWQKQLERARRNGSYTAVQGTIARVDRTDSGSVQLHCTDAGGAAQAITADYLVDATGLIGDLRSHRLLHDLVEVSGAPRNVLGRLDVSTGFEITALRSGPGRIFAAGAATEGAYYAPADSLLGLQYAALRIADQLADDGFGKKITSARSVAQWCRFMRGVAP
ncbi:hypothetical protein [Actinokineospora bangkokensis]|nr:hypothetical protein [Actinokineospora bangkokensis]